MDASFVVLGLATQVFYLSTCTTSEDLSHVGSSNEVALVDLDIDIQALEVGFEWKMSEIAIEKTQILQYKSKHRRGVGNVLIFCSKI